MSRPTTKTNSQTLSDQIPFRIHPRVFAALGADLVTNDVVAVIELVKNSYDAFAQNVLLRFCDDSNEGLYLEILDDGSDHLRPQPPGLRKKRAQYDNKIPDREAYAIRKSDGMEEVFEIST